MERLNNNFSKGETHTDEPNPYSNTQQLKTEEKLQKTEIVLIKERT